MLNNPLSLTDPTGFFFGKIFKAIGNFFGKVLSVVKSAFKAILNVPILRTGIQIAACISLQVYGCVAAAGAIAIAAGGSLADSVKAMAFSAASWGIWSGVGIALQGLSDLPAIAAAVVKGAVHGVVGGGLSIAQGGGFLEGFAANAIGGAAGVFSDAISQGSLGVDTMIVAVAGGAASVAAGGKFANGALTAAFANMYNKLGARAFAGAGTGTIGLGDAAAAGLQAGLRGLGQLLGAPFVFLTGLVGNSTTLADAERIKTLFRAVDTNELNDIISCQCFRSRGIGLEAKSFTPNLGSARFFLDRLSLTNIVATYSSRGVYDRLWHGVLDGQPAVVVDRTMLPLFNADIKMNGGPVIVQ